MSEQKKPVSDIQVETFAKFAQYIAGIVVTQDVWREFGKIIHTLFSANVVAHGAYDEKKAVQIIAYLKNGSAVSGADILFDQMSVGCVFESDEVNIVDEVLESGLMALHEKNNIQLLFLPIESSHGTTDVLIVGYLDIPDFSSEMLNLFLAVSGLISTTLSKNRAQKELQKHQDNMIRVLDQKVIERTNELEAANRQLQGEIEVRKIVQKERDLLNKELCETARIAGMATVATDVLHNVGNSINSVNVSVSTLEKRIAQSDIRDVRLIFNLLSENEPGLGEFFREDPKGKRILPYLDELAGRLDQEVVIYQNELKRLRKQVSHVMSVIAQQQTYVNGGNEGYLVETTPSGLIQECLDIIKTSYDHHDILIKTEYLHTDKDPISVEKHKLIQVVVNLLTNAKDAISERNKAENIEGRVDVVSSIINKEWIISIADNGFGIPKEHIQTIFQFGFTTKKQGHGFGLHSASNLISEMKGHLTAGNKKEGGAVFEIKIPLSA